MKKTAMHDNTSNPPSPPLQKGGIGGITKFDNLLCRIVSPGISYLIIISLLLIPACGGGGGSSKETSQVTILASFQDVHAASLKVASSTITHMRCTVAGPGMDKIVKVVPVIGNVVTINLFVPTGHQRHFLIEAMDKDNNVRYTGASIKDLFGKPVIIEITLTATSPLVGQMITMMTFNPNETGNGTNIYLYDSENKTMSTVKQNTNAIGLFPSISPDQSMIVYAEEAVDDSTYLIKIYYISSKTTNIIATLTILPGFPHETYDIAAYFVSDNRVIFNGSSDGTLKSMNADGTDIVTIASPEPPYSFGMFWLSPDREKIVADEFWRACPDYNTCNYERLVLMNADGMGRTVIKQEYLGEWNALFWKPDSSGFLYYHHTFNVVGGVYQGETPKYNIIKLDGSIIDLSNSYMGNKDENICLFTKTGNLLSLSHQELYNGQTGTLIVKRPDLPFIADTMFGFDNTGEIYFANRNGTNFRRYFE